jgi:hypothetical protein
MPRITREEGDFKGEGNDLNFVLLGRLHDIREV